MGMEQDTPSSSLRFYAGREERGAGGKFRKPLARRPPTTPYERPPADQSQRRDSGWLSKLVDPAYRIIAGGATRILPSIFSKSTSAAATTTEDHNNGGTKVKENVCGDDEGCTLNLRLSKSTGGNSPMKEADKVNCSSDFDQFGRDKTSNLLDGPEFSKIEQLVKGRSFSRDEINHLTEILNSRVTDLPNVELEAKEPNMATKREGEAAVLAREIPRLSTDIKQKGLETARAGTSMSLLQSSVKEVGASPVDIARAYMRSSLSEVGTNSKRMMSKDESVLLESDGFALEPLILSPPPMSSVCWPGAMVQDQHKYSTPQSVSNRYGSHYYQRTPYSRTSYSKSMTRLTNSQADKKGYLNILSNPRLQSQNPLYGQPKGDVFNDGFGSVGPIRRLRRKFLSETSPRGSVSFHVSQNDPSQGGNSNISEGLLPATKKSLEAGSASTTTEFQSVDNRMTSSEVGMSTIQTSNRAVRAILEHLDRNKPTPTEKSAELQRVTALKKSLSSEVTDSVTKEGTSLQFHIHKSTNFVDEESSAQGNDGGNSNFEVKFQERSSSVASDVNKKVEASSTVNGTHDSQIKRTREAALAFSGFKDSRQRGTNEVQPFHNQISGRGIGSANTVPNSAGPESSRKPPFQPPGAKPTLASISVAKQDLRQTVFSDSSSGFTFPVSSSSGVLSEPPTPSIMPSTSASGPLRPKEGPAIPSYTFGTKRSAPALVFSFPSMSTASMQDDASNLKFTSNPKFTFGSDEKNRISFRSVGKDGICF